MRPRPAAVPSNWPRWHASPEPLSVPRVGLAEALLLQRPIMQLSSIAHGTVIGQQDTEGALYQPVEQPGPP